MEIKLLDVSPLDFKGDTCVYLVFTDKYNLLIETGTAGSLSKLLTSIEEEGLTVRDVDMVFVTHIHLDHAGAAGHLVARNSRLKVYVHPRGYPHLLDTSKLWASSKSTLGQLARIYGSPLPIRRVNLVRADDYGEIDLGEDSIVTIFTPGHASHHMVLYMPESRKLFSGDAAGIYYSGIHVPITPKPHNPDKAIASLDKLMKLKVDTVYFTHISSYTPGLEILSQARDRWIFWRDLFKGFYEAGYDVDYSYGMLLKSDAHARKLDEFYKSRGFGQEELKVSVRGMLSYFEWLSGRS